MARPTSTAEGMRPLRSGAPCSPYVRRRASDAADLAHPAVHAGCRGRKSTSSDSATSRASVPSGFWTCPTAALVLTQARPNRDASDSRQRRGARPNSADRWARLCT
eukprot:3386984-Alexandrium_andersonii.AAC.1